MFRLLRLFTLFALIFALYALCGCGGPDDDIVPPDDTCHADYYACIHRFCLTAYEDNACVRKVKADGTCDEYLYECNPS